jgi:ankyrin repeat protein
MSIEYNRVKLQRVYDSPYDTVGCVKVLIAAKADVSVKLPNGISPIQFAASFNIVEAVKLLIDAGANVNDENVNNETVLHAACASGAIRVVNVLLEAGANPNTVSKDETPLITAIYEKHVDIVKALIAAGADVNYTRGRSSSVMDVANTVGNQQIIAMMEDAGAQLSLSLEIQKSPILTAVAKGQLFHVFENCRPSANTTAREKEAALMLAVQTSQRDIVKFLLSHRVNPCCEHDGSIPIISACIFGDAQIASDLIDAGADIAARAGNGMSTMEIALKKQHRDIVALLMAKAYAMSKRGM